MPKRKKNKRTPQKPMIERHPLELIYTRGKHPSYVLNATVRTPGSPLGSFAPNWLGCGALADMLRAVFFGDEARFVQARAELRETGFSRRPQQIHFDTLTLIERAYPNLITREELAGELDIDTERLDTVLVYLRRFVVTMCGVSVLSDWRGSVGIATVDLWAIWQSRMARLVNGVSEAQLLQGMSEDTMKRYGLGVTERLPEVHPVLLAPQMRELEGSNVN